MAQRISFYCPMCRERLTAKHADAGKQARCRRCNTAIHVPEGNAVPVQHPRTAGTVSPGEPDGYLDLVARHLQGRKRRRLILWGSAAAMVLVLGLVCGLTLYPHWAADHRASQAKTRANQTVAASVRRAEILLAEGHWDRAIVELEEGLTTEGATELEGARDLLSDAWQARAHSEAKRARALAQEKAARLFLSARAALEQANAVKARQLLQDYLASGHAAEAEAARSLLTDLEWVTSDGKAAALLRALSDESLATVAQTGRLPEGIGVSGKLPQIYADTLRRNVAPEQDRRTAVRLQEETERRATEGRLKVQLRLMEARLQLLERRLRFTQKTTQLNREELALLLEQELGLVLEQGKGLDEDQSRFGLGVLQFVRGVERLGQSLHHHGARSENTNLPFLRLPVPKNEDPAPLSYLDFRRLLDDFRRDLSAAEEILAGVTGDTVQLPLRLARIRLDLKGDGKATEGLLDVLKKIMALPEFDFLKTNPDFLVCFDRGDVAWLRAYCHLLMGMLDCYLAFDTEELFALSADQLFARPKNPFQGMGGAKQHKLNEATNVFAVKEPARLGRLRKHLLQVCALNHETWKFIRAETDDDREWLPNPRQKGVLRLPVSAAMIDAWLGMVGELEGVLNGKKLLPVSLIWDTGGKGLNLKALLDDPPDKLNLDAIKRNGPAARYLEEGTSVGFDALFRIAQVFENPLLVAYAVWFN